MSREDPHLPAGRGFPPVRMIDQRRDVSRRPYAAGGFTLLEVLLVVGLMALLASFAWPALQARFDHAQLPESADQMRSLMALTRAQAMMDHRRYRIRFAPNERQPVVEWEKDPFSAPGKYELIKADWTADDRLMGEAQVHEIRAGRPEYTLPLDDERSEQQQTETTEVVVSGDESSAAADEPTAAAPPPSDMTSDAPIDEKRPVLVFEPDGTSDWATVILANVEPAKPLEQTAEQIWIEIDGRSGLASVRPSLSEQEMADASLRIPRSKLRPPEVAFGKDKTINAVTDQKPGQGKGKGDGTASKDGEGLQAGAGGGTPQLPGGTPSLEQLTALSKMAGGQQPGGGGNPGDGSRKPPGGNPRERQPHQQPPQSPTQNETQNDQNSDQTTGDHSQDTPTNPTDQTNQNNDNQPDTTTQPTHPQP